MFQDCDYGNTILILNRLGNYLLYIYPFLLYCDINNFNSVVIYNLCLVQLYPGTMNY